MTTSKRKLFPTEEKWMPIVAEKSETTTVYYNPANPDDMQKLSKDSGIRMVGMVKEQAKWLGRVYKSNAAYGFGLVAKRLIKKDENIAPYLGSKHVDEPNTSEKVQAYAFGYDEVFNILGHERSSVAAFANHNFSIPNVYCKKENGQLIFKACHDIPEGCALLIDYDEAYAYNEEEVLYLSPYQNGKSPADNLKQHQALYDTRTIELTDELKRAFKITSKATHCIVPKIFYDPDHTKNLEYTDYKHLPVYLAVIDDEKITVLHDQPYISTLMLACATKDSEKIKKLLLNGADVFAETMNRVSVLSIIASMISPSDSDFKDIYISILEKIHKKYEESYEMEEVKNQFMTYINKRVHNHDALDIVNERYKGYKQYLFEKEDSQEVKPIATKAVSPEEVKNEEREKTLRPVFFNHMSKRKKSLSLPESEMKTSPVSAAEQQTTQDTSLNIAAAILCKLKADSCEEVKDEEREKTLSPLLGGGIHEKQDSAKNSLSQPPGPSLSISSKSEADERVNQFKHVLSKQNGQAIKFMWDNDLFLQEYFSGMPATLDGVRIQITQKECLENFKAALAGRCTCVINTIWDKNIVLRQHIQSLEGKDQLVILKKVLCSYAYSFAYLYLQTVNNIEILKECLKDVPNSAHGRRKRAILQYRISDLQGNIFASTPEMKTSPVSAPEQQTTQDISPIVDASVSTENIDSVPAMSLKSGADGHIKRFKRVLLKRNAQVISSIWDNDPFLQNYFSGVYFTPSRTPISLLVEH